MKFYKYIGYIVIFQTTDLYSISKRHIAIFKVIRLWNKQDISFE